MAAIKHILFPFDFSGPGFHAARFVRAVAEHFDARITLFGVVPPVWDVPPPMGVPAIAVERVDSSENQLDLKSRLDVALTDELAGVCVQRATSYGDPAVMITEFADANTVDLIMMPTHGFGLFRNLLIGSVTAKVLHDAKCAVWTATHAEEQRSRDLPKTVLCAIDGSPKTPALIQWAAEYSAKMDATLKLLHVVHPVSDWLALPSERELQEQVREEARERVEALVESAGVGLSVRVAVGPIADTVTEEARQEGADLVIIGRGALPGTLGRLRTHAYGIIQKSPCPVVSV